MKTVFVRHGILSNAKAIEGLANRLATLPDFEHMDNRDYPWKCPVIKTGLKLAEQVLDRPEKADAALLVGHSQGGLVCRVAAIALKGRPRGTCGESTAIRDWQEKRSKARDKLVSLGVVTIATPNCGALGLGQMSMTTEVLSRAGLALADYAGLSNLKDLTTPRLFQEFEHWSVTARYLSVSGVRVNRFKKSLWDRAAEIKHVDRFAVRLEKPNDGIVEDSSTDLRQSLIRPEVDLEQCYRHARAYPHSIELGHYGIQESMHVYDVIRCNISWLFP